MDYTECDVTAKLAESRYASKRMRKLGMLWKTVATHHLKELRHLRTVENLQPGGEVMVSIDARHAMDSGFAVHYPPLRKKPPRVCGQK